MQIGRGSNIMINLPVQLLQAASRCRSRARCQSRARSPETTRNLNTKSLFRQDYFHRFRERLFLFMLIFFLTFLLKVYRRLRFDIRWLEASDSSCHFDLITLWTIFSRLVFFLQSLHTFNSNLGISQANTILVGLRKCLLLDWRGFISMFRIILFLSFDILFESLLAGYVVSQISLINSFTNEFIDQRQFETLRRETMRCSDFLEPLCNLF